MSADGLRRYLLFVLLLGLQLLLSRLRGLAGCLRLLLRLLRCSFLLLCLLFCSRYLAQVQQLLSSSQIPVTARAHICTPYMPDTRPKLQLSNPGRLSQLQPSHDAARASDCASSAVFFSLAACFWAVCTAAYSFCASSLAALAWHKQSTFRGCHCFSCWHCHAAATCHTCQPRAVSWKFDSEGTLRSCDFCFKSI